MQLCQYYQIMNSQAHQYIRIKHVMTTDPDHLEFEERLKSSPINNNRYYLGLLLMAIVSMPAPKIQYIRTLLKFGADINFTEPSSIFEKAQTGKSIFMIACEKSVSANVKYLLSYENLQVGNLDLNGENALHFALRNRDQSEAVLIFEHILKQFPHLIAHNGIGKKKILFLAIEACKLKIIQFLIRNYVDPNEQTEPAGITALHYTISLSGQMKDKSLQQILLLLLKCKADPKKKNYLSEDCYDYADKYLFDLESLITITDQYEQMQQTQQKGNKCFTLNTYADSHTAFSKDESQIDDGKIQQLQQYIKASSIISYQLQQNSEVKPIQEECKYYKYGKQQQVFCKSPIVYYDDSEVQRIQQQTQSQQDYDAQAQQTIQQMHASITKQIWQNNNKYLQQYESARNDITQIWNFLTQLGHKLELALNMIGSFATGLWTYHSDIDLVFINQKAKFVNINYLLEKVHKHLQHNFKKLKIKEIYINLQSKFPNIKLKLNQSLNQRRIQIGIFQRKCSGRKYVQFITNHLQHNPLILPTFYTFHKLIQSFDLHKPTKNGLKTYTIFLMILVAFQALPTQTMAQAFINLIYYFNNYHCYQYYNDEKNNRKAIFNMMDPLNTDNNTGGRDTDADKLILMFKSTQFAIIQSFDNKNCNNMLPLFFQLHQMFS